MIYQEQQTTCEFCREFAQERIYDGALPSATPSEIMRRIGRCEIDGKLVTTSHQCHLKSRNKK
jgi:phosphohistidine phosphatase SixA